jgi:Putative zinc-finger
MTSLDPATDGAAAWPDGHATDQLLASYADGTVATVALWSVEAHLSGCARCRSALSPCADPGRLARNRSVLLARAALPDDGPLRRLLRRCGVPDYVLDLLAATPSLRLSWLLSVLGVLAVVTAEAAAARYGWIRAVSVPGRAGASNAGVLTMSPGPLNPEVLATFLLVGPLLVVAGVAAAFLPPLDPAYRLAVAAPFSGVRLLLVRATCALLAALVPVACAGFVVPGPGWLPVGLLLPSLALCAFALAASTIIGPRAAAVAAGVVWALPALILALTDGPLRIVQSTAQVACAALLCISAVVLFLRQDRFDLGWTT